jgi:ornithine cyclodeaminase/alanine dehydrogenase-like protein (mu-crystallin family)
MATPPGNSIAVIDHEHVLTAVTPRAAIDRVRDGFERFARDRWVMPPKVYLQSPPGGDFRAMPALGEGIALLKWVTSFPDNPQRGLPTVTGIILLSDASTGEPLALVDARAVTALRTGASAAVATQVLAPPGAETAGIIGCGLHGAWAARCLKEAGFVSGVCSDTDPTRAAGLADELGWTAGSLGAALACDVVTLVTPGRSPVVTKDDLHPGLHINALGADGPGKAELDIDAVAACSVFCDEWAQASHGGEITGAVEAGRVDPADVSELGAVLTGTAAGRLSPDEVTLFDSTGLAIQDLAIAMVLLDQLNAGDLEAPSISL